jgi:hypothetical protein
VAMAGLPNMDWQIKRRKKIQKLLLKQYSHLDRNHDLFRDNDNYRYSMLRLTQASFSLWRSVFLTDKETNPKNLYDDTKGFLKTVLQTNAITFGNDYT